MAAPPVSERHLHHFHRQSPIKEAVRAATTGNITISSALNNGDTIDGVTLATDDRVLVKDQTTGSENGLYVVGVTPVRAYDQSTDDPAFGFIVRVREGTVNTGKVYANTNTTVPTIGTTALTFAALPSSDLSGIDFLVGTATGLLSGEIVAGTTPGGELGGTWASPTVDGTHSGSAHTDFIAKSLLTTQDDIIVRDGTGPARLGKGSDGQVLTVDPTTHHLVWATPSSGFSNPMTTKGDLIVGDTGGSAIRKAVGSDTQVLTADSTATGGIKWAAAGGGGGSDLVQTNSGAGSVYIPGLRGSPDALPASPSSYDDEFDTFSGWTQGNSPTIANVTDVPSHLHLQKTSATGIAVVYKACPSIPFTVTVKISDMAWITDYVTAILALLDSSPTTVYTAGPLWVNTLYLETTTWSASTWARSSFTDRNYGGYYWPQYIRLVVNSSTNIDFLVSFYGRYWITIATGLNPGFTVANVGVGVSGTTASVTAEAYFDWIRFT